MKDTHTHTHIEGDSFDEMNDRKMLITNGVKKKIVGV